MADQIITSINVILDAGGTNQLTVYSSQIVETWNKDIKLIKRPQTKSAAASGPKATKILDLLKVEQRFELRGFIDKADKTKARNVLKTKGPVTITNYDSESLSGVFDKIEITKTSQEIKDMVVTAGDRIETEFLEFTGTFFTGDDL